MKKLAMALMAPLMTMIFLMLPASASLAAFEAGVSITEEGVSGFYLAVGDYYRVPEREVIIIKEKRIRDDEVPVVLFLASRCGWTSTVIVDLRLGGLTWIDITRRCGLTAEIFYVEVAEVKGPPYGRAYGYYKKPRSEWATIVLTDAEVVNFVNLRFMSEYYGYKPELVIQMRSEGKDFIEINDNIKKGKSGKGGEKKGKGKGKGK